MGLLLSPANSATLAFVHSFHGNQYRRCFSAGAQKPSLGTHARGAHKRWVRLRPADRRRWHFKNPSSLPPSVPRSAAARSITFTALVQPQQWAEVAEGTCSFFAPLFASNFLPVHSCVITGSQVDGRADGRSVSAAAAAS